MYMREVKVYSCGFEKFLSLQVYRLFRIGITGKFWGQMQLVRVTSAPYLERSISEISEELEEEEDVIAQMIREMGEERAAGKEEQ